MREFATYPDDVPELPEHWVELEYQVSLASTLKIGNPNYPRHKIGRFEAIILRGFGGFGVVFKVYDPELERDVALKLVRPMGRNARERVLKEARALAKVSHPNVITVLETGQYGDDLFFTMELTDGDTAADFCCRRPRPTWQEIVDLYREAGAGLAAAHRAGVVHGDFKPSNILINRDGTWPRVADFGLAKIRIQNAPEAERDEYCRRGGTLPYMAPEVLRGNQADARSDQFSFCVALWQSLERVLPFLGDTQDMLEQIDAADPWFTGEYAPEALRDVLRVGLSADPNDRYPDMDALVQAIRDARRTLGELDADDMDDDDEVEALPMIDDMATAEWARQDVRSVGLVEAEALDDMPTADSERQDVGPVGVVDAAALDDVPTADSKRPDDGAAVVEAPQPATSPPPPPKGPGWGPFTAVILFAAVSLGVSTSQRLSTESAARGKGVTLFEPDPRLASASACAVTHAEKDHPVPAEAEGICSTIRLGEVQGAARMWQREYDDRLPQADGAPDPALALDSLIMARTFVSQAERFLLDGRRDATTKAAHQAHQWSTQAASVLGNEHAGVRWVLLRHDLIRTVIQPQHSTTPLPSMLP